VPEARLWGQLNTLTFLARKLHCLLVVGGNAMIQSAASIEGYRLSGDFPYDCRATRLAKLAEGMPVAQRDAHVFMLSRVWPRE